MRLRPSLRPLVATTLSHPARRRWLGTRLYWICQFTGWALVAGLFLLANIAADRPHRWVVPVFMFSGGLVCTHLLRVLILHRRHQVRSWTGFLLPLLPWTLACGMALTGILHLAALGFAPEMIAGERLPLPLAYWLPVCETSVLLLGWTGLYLGIAYFRGYQKAETERQTLAGAVQEAELRLLKSQIDPHFLFNSLNTLRSLITRDPRQARDAITLIADLLRASLTTNNRPLIQLAEELEVVRSYLTLEQLRFEERLSVRWSVAPETLPCTLPPSALQTLVENAVKHGIAPRTEGGEVAVAAELLDGALRLTVTNPGRLDAPRGESTRIGLSNTRGRLRHLCGGEARLVLEQRAPDQVAAVLTIPPATPVPLEPSAAPATR